MSNLSAREERPPYVRFVRRGVEDRNATIANGCYTTKDVDFALITPQGSKDLLEQEVQPWFNMLASEVRNGRFPSKWLDGFREGYRMFQKGEEMPLDGTPVKNWSVPSPAQVQALIAMRLLTVEDVAAANDDTLRGIGIGAVSLRQAAKDYLTQTQSTGKAVLEMSALRSQITTLKNQLTASEESNKMLSLEVIQLRAALGNPGAQTMTNTTSKLQPVEMDEMEIDLNEPAGE